MPPRSAKKMWGKAMMMVRIVNAFKKSRVYKTEGDPAMETAAMLAARRGLKMSGAINAQIQRFWGVVDLLKDPASGELTRASYCALNVKIQKAMVSDFVAEEAERDARTDWSEDMRRFRAARGQGAPDEATTMSFGDFRESMFELADLWCDDVLEGSYVGFLQEVLGAVAKDISGGGGGGDGGGGGGGGSGGGGGGDMGALTSADAGAEEVEVLQLRPTDEIGQVPTLAEWMSEDEEEEEEQEEGMEDEDTLSPLDRGGGGGGLEEVGQRGGGEAEGSEEEGCGAAVIAAAPSSGGGDDRTGRHRCSRRRSTVFGNAIDDAAGGAAAGTIRSQGGGGGGDGGGGGGGGSAQTAGSSHASGGEEGGGVPSGGLATLLGAGAAAVGTRAPRVGKLALAANAGALQGGRDLAIALGSDGAAAVDGEARTHARQPVAPRVPSPLAAAGGARPRGCRRGSQSFDSAVAPAQRHQQESEVGKGPALPMERQLAKRPARRLAVRRAMEVAVLEADGCVGDDGGGASAGASEAWAAGGGGGGGGNDGEAIGGGEAGGGVVLSPVVSQQRLSHVGLPRPLSPLLLPDAEAHALTRPRPRRQPAPREAHAMNGAGGSGAMDIPDGLCAGVLSPWERRRGHHAGGLGELSGYAYAARGGEQDLPLQTKLTVDTHLVAIDSMGAALRSGKQLRSQRARDGPIMQPWSARVSSRVLSPLTIPRSPDSAFGASGSPVAPTSARSASPSPSLPSPLVRSRRLSPVPITIGGPALRNRVASPRLPASPLSLTHTSSSPRGYAPSCERPDVSATSQGPVVHARILRTAASRMTI